MMGTPISDPYWPLAPGTLQLDVLRPVLPLSFNQLSEAFQFELISLGDLDEILRTKGATVGEPSELLRTFLRTVAIFDRGRDVQEELDRLAALEGHVRPPLWKVLAALIVRRNVDDKTKLYALESLSQTFGRPAQLIPYTMFGEVRGIRHEARDKLMGLRALLEQDFPPSDTGS